MSKTDDCERFFNIDVDDDLSIIVSDDERLIIVDENLFFDIDDDDLSIVIKNIENDLFSDKIDEIDDDRRLFSVVSEDE